MSCRRDRADRLFAAEKLLLPPPRWEAEHRGQGQERQRKLECLIQIDGVVEADAMVNFISSSGRLNKFNLSLMARTSRPQKWHPLYRLDMNPPGPHTNKLWGPSEVYGKFIPPGVTHEHLYLDCLEDDGSLRVPCDAQARPLSRPPADFAEAVDYFCDRLNITLARPIPDPGNQGELL